MNDYLKERWTALDATLRQEYDYLVSVNTNVLKFKVSAKKREIIVIFQNPNTDNPERYRIPPSSLQPKESH